MKKKTALEIQTNKVKRKYDRFSKFYNLFEKPMEIGVLNKLRKELIQDLKGNILEVGVGTGKNLKYYNSKAKVTGIDISPGMLGKAYLELNKLGNKNIELKEMDAQNMEFKDNKFDYVLCTFVLCSVPNPIKVLEEMKRVVKPSGKVLMIEHMLSEHLLLAIFEHIHNPLTKFLLGVNIDRKTIENIKKSGLKISREDNLMLFDVFKRIEAVK